MTLPINPMKVCEAVRASEATVEAVNSVRVRPFSATSTKLFKGGVSQLNEIELWDQHELLFG